jgi:hypothetical protein
MLGFGVSRLTPTYMETWDGMTGEIRRNREEI